MQQRGENFLFLDVREPDEWRAAHLAGTRLVPLGELPARIGELSDWKERPVVVHCRSGVRSAQACRILHEHGFADVWNLSGGIQAWALTVDPRVSQS